MEAESSSSSSSSDNAALRASLRLVLARYLDFHCPNAKKRLFEYLLLPALPKVEAQDEAEAAEAAKLAAEEEAAAAKRKEEEEKKFCVNIETMAGSIVVPRMEIDPAERVHEVKARIFEQCSEFPGHLTLLFMPKGGKGDDDLSDLQELPDYDVSHPSGRPVRMAAVVEAKPKQLMVALRKVHNTRLTQVRYEYAKGDIDCPRCRHTGPSSKTGHRMCRDCGWCGSCCIRADRCGTDPNAELPVVRCPNTQSALATAQKEYMSDYQRWRYRTFRPSCWAGQTWVFVLVPSAEPEPGRPHNSDDAPAPVVVQPKRVRQLCVGDVVFTGSERPEQRFRRVQRILKTFHGVAAGNNGECNVVDDSAELVRFSGVWMTSHHPVLCGAHWRYPADTTEEVYSARDLAPRVGPVFNLELEGHVDTIVVAGDGATPDLAASFLTSTVGKYIPTLGGWSHWTRRTVACDAHAPEHGRVCAQCEQCLVQALPTQTVQLERFGSYKPAPQVEYPSMTRDWKTFYSAGGCCWTPSQVEWLNEHMADPSDAKENTANCEYPYCSGPTAAAGLKRSSQSWRQTVLQSLTARLAEGKMPLTMTALDQLIASHSAASIEASPSSSGKLGGEEDIRRTRACDPTRACAMCGDEDGAKNGDAVVLACCQAQCCHRCLGTHAASWVRASHFQTHRGVPCPVVAHGCTGKVPMYQWQQLVPGDVAAPASSYAEQLLRVGKVSLLAPRSSTDAVPGAVAAVVDGTDNTSSSWVSSSILLPRLCEFLRHGRGLEGDVGAAVWSLCRAAKMKANDRGDGWTVADLHFLQHSLQARFGRCADRERITGLMLELLRTQPMVYSGPAEITCFLCKTTTKDGDAAAACHSPDCGARNIAARDADLCPRCPSCATRAPDTAVAGEAVLCVCSKYWTVPAATAATAAAAAAAANVHPSVSITKPNTATAECSTSLLSSSSFDRPEAPRCH